MYFFERTQVEIFCRDGPDIAEIKILSLNKAKSLCSKLDRRQKGVHWQIQSDTSKHHIPFQCHAEPNSSEMQKLIKLIN
jgi:hypothetical protein